MFKVRSLSLAAVLTISTFGCGGVPKPEAQLSSSEGAIRGAQEAGAESVPEATLYVKLAEEQRQHALELIKHGDNHRAGMLLARAESDAELAVALAHAAAAKTEADQAREAVDTIKDKAAQ